MPVCSSAVEVSSLPPSPTQNAAAVVGEVLDVQFAAGCAQVPLTDEYVCR